MHVFPRHFRTFKAKNAACIVTKERKEDSRQFVVYARLYFNERIACACDRHDKEWLKRRRPTYVKNRSTTFPSAVLIDASSKKIGNVVVESESRISSSGSSSIWRQWILLLLDEKEKSSDAAAAAAAAAVSECRTHFFSLTLLPSLSLSMMYIPSMNFQNG